MSWFREQIVNHGMTYAVGLVLGTFVWLVRRAYQNTLVAKYQGDAIRELQTDVREIRAVSAALHRHLIGQPPHTAGQNTSKQNGDDNGRKCEMDGHRS